MAGITLLFSEVLDKVHKAKTKDQKVKILREHNSPALRSVLKSSFDPNIKWVLPEGDVPYTKNEAPAGTEHTTLATESRKLWHFIKGGDGETPQWKKEQMFVRKVAGNTRPPKAIDKKQKQTYLGKTRCRGFCGPVGMCR